MKVTTVSTDASFNVKYSKGSFAFWIANDSGRFYNSGLIKGKMDSPLMCEMKSILLALEFLIKFKIAEESRKIIINTDCLNAIHVLRSNKDKIVKYKLSTRKLLQLKNEIHNIIFRNFPNIKIYFRHIKAHTNNKSINNYANNWCDKECKKHIGIFIKNQKP